MSGKTSIVDDNSIEREVKKVAITVGKTERKVAKIMQTVNGVWQNVYSSGITLHFTGTTDKGTDLDYEFDDGTVNLKFLSNGTLTVVDGEATIEACLVGGGYKGTHGEYSETPGYPPGNYNQWATGEPGGFGGFVYNTPQIQLKAGDSFEIKVGGQGANTTAFGYSSASGKQQKGNGGNGFHAFNDSSYDGVLYAPSGGHGSSWHYENYHGPYKDSDYTPGGKEGGGDGSTHPTKAGSNATGYGGGGGGGCGKQDGGSGSSGIVIARSVKEAG